jgi:3-oxoacyl-(acyl-carrier-protein) synthase
VGVGGLERSTGIVGAEIRREDFGEEGSFEFAQMGATSSSISEAAAGREPNEQCRPCTSSRNGFMESQGAGVQILTTAALALEMGLPVYAIVAGVSTATDRQGRSIPAPGVGILSTARETARQEKPSPLLNLAYRRRQIERECAWLEAVVTIASMARLQRQGRPPEDQKRQQRGHRGGWEGSSSLACPGSNARCSLLCPLFSPLC